LTDRKALERLLLNRSVQRGDFVLTSGQRSSYYIDCRLATMSAEGMALIGRMGLDAIRQAGWKPDSVGGLTMGADPVAYAIAAASFDTDAPVDAFKPGHAVVVVEDVITSGGSARRAAATIEDAGGKVLGVLAVVDREEGGKDALEREGRRVVTLTTAAGLGLG
jgi:orotate phosphoribosyltransferase